MERLHLPATFYIITGPIKGSRYQGKFIGRPVEDIINPSVSDSTNEDNYFEKASAAKYLGYIGANALYAKSAIAFEGGKIDKAHKIMDTLYEKVRNGALKKSIEFKPAIHAMAPMWACWF